MRTEEKLIVQVLMSRGLLREAELSEIYEEVRQRCEVKDNVQFNQFRIGINAHLSKVAMEIKQKRDEDTGEQMYALVQTVESDLGKLTTDYQPHQLELFKKTVGLIVTSPHGMASSMDILNLVDSKKDAEDTLKQFVKDNWLNEREGDVWMSARCIMELEMYLRQTYDPIDQCRLCKEIVFKGELCSQCEIKLHGYCAERLFRGKDRVCPNCSQPWQ